MPRPPWAANRVARAEQESIEAGPRLEAPTGISWRQPRDRAAVSQRSREISTRSARAQQAAPPLKRGHGLRRCLCRGKGENAALGGARGHRQQSSGPRTDTAMNRVASGTDAVEAVERRVQK